jgi:hypothetical protein
MSPYPTEDIVTMMHQNVSGMLENLNGCEKRICGSPSIMYMNVAMITMKSTTRYSSSVKPTLLRRRLSPGVITQ